MENKLFKLQKSKSEAIAEYNTQLQTWNESNKFENLVADGTNKGTTYHHGFIAQEVGN
jgi:hypothetical protein